MMRIELMTSPLPRECSTTEPHGQYFSILLRKNGAGEEVRTLDIKLGRLALYQLSYTRSGVLKTSSLYNKKKMVARDGFEPSKAEPADLQSAPFGHSGTSPEISLLQKWS
jgi:hypothetical protein